MTSENTHSMEEPGFNTELGPIVLKDLEARIAEPAEMDRVRDLLAKEHCLEPALDVGRTLVQVVHHQGQWVGILTWGPATVRIIEREEWIGWTHQQREQRLGLIVQNRRFLLLSKTRLPNLACRALTLALRCLPEHWESIHGYKPLLAETLTDIESFEGPCYKVSDWMPCGETKGFEREHTANFYHEHKRPKKLWLKPLSRNTRTILCATDVPVNYRAGVTEHTPERALPINNEQIESLREALRGVPDPRRNNRSWSLSALLTLIGMGLLAGRKNLAEIHRFGQFLTQPQRERLRFLHKPGGVCGRRAPSYQVLYHVLKMLDPNDLAEALNGWLAAHLGELPRSLALDGKYVRDLVLTLAFSDHETGAPVAMTIASKEPKTEKAKTEGELTAAKRLYRSVNLNGATVTADALHCEKESMQMVVENGGDFLVQLKKNAPTAFAQACGFDAGASPCFASETIDLGHGRLDTRKIRIYSTTPMEMGLPNVRTLIVVEKTSLPGSGKPPEVKLPTRKGKKKRNLSTVSEVLEEPKEKEDPISYYLSSHAPRNAGFFGELIRGHWGGCEIRNHWVRDAIFQEDATRSKDPHLNGNLAILRGALISLKARLAPDKAWPFIQEFCSMKPSLATNMICRGLFK